jgi:N-sulfoglucosamine sulfohydrolase
MYYPMRCVIDGDYKYILNIAHPLPYPFASDLYSSPTWQGILKRGDMMLGQRPVKTFVQRPRHELYHLANDPDELRNLADAPQHAARLKELQQKVRDWQKATSDPWATKWVYE